jgi:Domain of unknown function (DUF4198)
MYRICKFVCVMMLSVAGLASPAAAQTLWLASESNGETKVHCYFSGVEDRGELIDKVLANRVWRMNERKSCEPMILRKEAESLWFSAEDKGIGSTYWLSHDFGVSEMAGVSERIFLHAKIHTSADPSTWWPIRNSKHLQVEIIPRRENLNHRFTVLSLGKPLAATKVNIVGPDSFKTTDDTDENGEVTFELPQSGTYGLCVRHVDSENRKLSGHPIVQTVHVSTSSLPLEVIPDAKLTTRTTK